MASERYFRIKGDPSAQVWRLVGAPMFGVLELQRHAGCRKFLPIDLEEVTDHSRLYVCRDACLAIGAPPALQLTEGATYELDVDRPMARARVVGDPEDYFFTFGRFRPLTENDRPTLAPAPDISPEYAFFSAVPAGHCACGIPRSDCRYHQ